MMRFQAQKILVLTTLVLTLGFYGMVDAQSPVTPIPQQIGAQKVEVFIGSPVTAKPITTSVIPQHPFMANNGRSNVHNDTYMSDTYIGSGPLGQSPEVLSSVLGGDIR